MPDDSHPDAPNLPHRTVGAAHRRLYQPNPKHGPDEYGRVSREPRDGQDALDWSVRVKPTSPVRIGIDYDDRTFVVLRRHEDGGSGRPFEVVYHGYVVPWEGLTQPMRNALIRAGMADRRGRIL